ncbi:porin [Paraburkholderia sp. CNPSo 3157]|uniref:Porin n=1 Tax=Paraburkholderia franconis TaxID=2654983 RepID=A0A7X1TG66_9BURK|nr:porin [Paraburkholderia franconis]MPW18073.1 porin [Paraburkholderia franconis]
MKYMLRNAAFVSLCVSGNCYAQSSVTLYGVLDTGLNYTSNSGGHHSFAMVSGDTAETSFGLKGTEDLGGGLSAIFTLENGVNLNTGQLNEGGRLFGRQAFVGLSSTSAGTLTLGRQYDATVDMWSPFTAAGSSIGDLAAHPFDNDNADFDFRLNNSIKYVSPTLYGFQLEGVYGFSNTTNFSANRAYSAGLTYTVGPLSLVVAYLHLNGVGTTTDGAITSDAVFVAPKQENIDAGVKWTFSENANVSLAYSHVSVTSPTANAYAPNIGTQAWTSWKFDNVEINGQYYLMPDLSLIGAYTYTHGRLESTTGSDSPNWHQVALMLNYSLSKRTSVYVQGAWQHTNGKTGTDFDGAHIVGSSGVSSSGNQAVARIAMSHKF